MAQKISIIDISIDGQKVDVEKGAKLKIGGYVAEAKPSARKVHYTQKLDAAEIEFEVAATADVNVLGLQALRNATVQVVADNGLQYVVSNAFVTEKIGRSVFPSIPSPIQASTITSSPTLAATWSPCSPSSCARSSAARTTGGQICSRIAQLTAPAARSIGSSGSPPR